MTQSLYLSFQLLFPSCAQTIVSFSTGLPHKLEKVVLLACSLYDLSVPVAQEQVELPNCLNLRLLRSDSPKVAMRSTPMLEQRRSNRLNSIAIAAIRTR